MRYLIFRLRLAVGRAIWWLLFPAYMEQKRIVFPGVPGHEKSRADAEEVLGFLDKKLGINSFDLFLTGRHKAGKKAD